MGLSTHILDVNLGKPAADVSLVLSCLNEDQWDELGRGSTDADGRCRTLLGDHHLEVGTYKIRFATSEYYAAQHITGLYPYVEIVFNVREPEQHYHIPLLLTAHGYSTYRGS
ncbi:hydroxyisourate hydrolase [Granulicella cerasi]|uniref:5-hydroxyisourate hydrolase n=1 Tax=Granulicella cerasi TaxID=741063 RepID=A0ABW1Z858_9BACT|nr:hydroxyisourate hydrolase [Granulicella cerasi]